MVTIILIEQPSAQKRYAIEFLLRTCGYSRREVAAPLDADLYYGNAPVSARTIVIPDRSPDVFSFDAIAGETALNPLPIDIVCATAAFNGHRQQRPHRL